MKGEDVRWVCRGRSQFVRRQSLVLDEKPSRVNTMGPTLAFCPQGTPHEGPRPGADPPGFGNGPRAHGDDLVDVGAERKVHFAVYIGPPQPVLVDDILVPGINHEVL